MLLNQIKYFQLVIFRVINLGLFGKKKEEKVSVPSELKTLNNIKEDAEK